jgi:hypothetical protein
LDQILKQMEENSKKLATSLTLEKMRPDIFKYGGVKLKHTGKYDPRQPKQAAPVFKAHMVDGNGHIHRLTKTEYEALNTGIATHSEYK